MSRSGSSTLSYGIETGVNEASSGQRISGSKIVSAWILGSGAASSGGAVGTRFLIGGGVGSGKTMHSIITPVKRETVVSGEKTGYGHK